MERGRSELTATKRAKMRPIYDKNSKVDLSFDQLLVLYQAPVIGYPKRMSCEIRMLDKRDKDVSATY